MGEQYIVVIFDIEDIKKPQRLEEISISAESKSEAMDKGHTEAERLYPLSRRLIQKYGHVIGNIENIKSLTKAKKDREDDKRDIFNILPLYEASTKRIATK